ncbi:unnamed protein product [Darwinula stevensoni]|uniref:Large ribosomal subunit protein mL39 n=1 Tax=Darwinula stevensoni TaxID=69355 RepID=A0A7R9AI82_9CRUS|nr:unnamed protein product [Darwinula stevensoni]CAG0905243.1 unnamed protein product [Darwinula stevensoni]
MRLLPSIKCKNAALSCFRYISEASSSAASVDQHDVLAKRNAMFNKEQERQRSLIARLEKIEVQYEGAPKNATLIMNKGLSTPFDCARHLTEMLLKRSCIAEVNGVPWDMHKPLVEDCRLRLLHFHDQDPFVANKTFWRSCSFMLGAVIESAFKDGVTVHLHSFPPPDVKSGSFVHDAQLGLPDWSPRKEELQILSVQMVKLAYRELKFERLEVSKDLALDMFQDNPHKRKQIPDIAEHSEGNVVLYRIGEHIDISKGPMMGSTRFLGRCTVAAVHRVQKDGLDLYRFQGVALPYGMLLNHFAYGLIEERGRLLNHGWSRAQAW